MGLGRDTIAVESVPLPTESSTLNLWLTAVAVLVVIALVVHIIPVFQRRISFDLNTLVPMLLECGGIIAATKMMVLSFRLGRIVRGNPVEELFDGASILIGGFVFFCASSHALLINVLEGYWHPRPTMNGLPQDTTGGLPGPTAGKTGENSQ